MKLLYVLAAIFVVAYAQSDDDYEIFPPAIIDTYPEWYIGTQQEPDVGIVARHRRDVTFDRSMGGGRVFGTLGQNDNGLFGKGGYERNIFDDHRGKLDGQVYGTRVLGPYGDSSHMGGGLNWKNSNAAASLDYSRQIHGPETFNAAAGGRWPVGKNGDFSLQGTYGKTSSFPSEYGGRAVYNYRW